MSLQEYARNMAGDIPRGTDPTRPDARYLTQLQHEASLLSLNSRLRAQSTGSGYRSSLKGRGLEFAETRPYLPGDEIRQIDWKVSARTGTTHTKLFQQERERPVLFVVDFSFNCTACKR